MPSTLIVVIGTGMAGLTAAGALASCFMFFGHRTIGFELEIGRQHQPPIADVLVSVREAAAMRALAHDSLALAARFTSPATIVHVIDKSSSMIASGYVDAARCNVRRTIQPASSASTRPPRSSCR